MALVNCIYATESSNGNSIFPENMIIGQFTTSSPIHQICTAGDTSSARVYINITSQLSQILKALQVDYNSNRLGLGGTATQRDIDTFRHVMDYAKHNPNKNIYYLKGYL